MNLSGIGTTSCNEKLDPLDKQSFTENSKNVVIKSANPKKKIGISSALCASAQR